MSLKWYNAVWNKSPMRGEALLVLMAIADESNDDGISRASINVIAHFARIAQHKSVQRIIKRLEAAGELIVTRTHGGAERNRYIVLTGRSAEEIQALYATVGAEAPTPVLKTPPSKRRPVTKTPRQKDTPVLKTGRVLKESINLKDSNTLEDSIIIYPSPSDDDERVKFFQAFGVSVRDAKALVQDPKITREDFLAELARGYKDPKVRKPYRIAPLNCLRGDRAPADWYDPTAWWDYIPEAALLKAGIERPTPVAAAESTPPEPQSPPETEQSSDTPTYSDYTHFAPQPLPADVAASWPQILHQLEMEMPRSAFDTWVRDLRPLGYDESGALVIGARNPYARDWVESRMTRTIERMFVGVVNQSVPVKFVSTGAA